jgi:hypothetical protein
MRDQMLAVLAAIAVSGDGSPVTQNPTQTLAGQIVERLGGTEGNAVAAQLAGDPTRFVAALHIPGVQLLVISSTYSADALLRERLLRKQFRETYLDLNSGGDRQGRFFVEDLGADGLRVEREPGRAFDITWRDAAHRTAYDGDWKKQKLSETLYKERFAKDSAEYATLLQALLNALVPEEPSPRALLIAPLQRR